MTLRKEEPSDPSELLEILRSAEASSQTQTGPRIIREEIASVRLNIWPQLIPRESVDPNQLNIFLDREFGSKLDKDRLEDAIPPGARVGLGPNDLLTHALRKGQDQPIVYIGGKLKIPESKRVTPIRNLWFAEQNLSAEVAGSTAEAEYCARQLAVLLNRAAGIDREWVDLAPHVENVAFRTATVVDLAVNFSWMLAPTVREFFASQVDGPGQYGLRMSGTGFQLDDVTKAGASHLQVSSGLERVFLKVAVFDSQSGDTYSANVEIVAHTNRDVNGSRVKIVTELPSPDHQRFVELLAGALRDAK